MLSELLDRLKKSKEFNQCLAKHKNFYLASIFLIENKLEINYYDKTNRKVITFAMERDIKVKEDNMFNNERLSELRLDKIKISLDDALKIVNNNKNKVITLQVINGIIVWNIICLDGLSFLNVKIDAISGDVVSREDGSLLNFK